MSATPRPSPSFAPVLVILLGLAAAHFAWSTTSQAERLERRQQEEQRGDAYAQRLLAYVNNQTGVLRFLRGWYRVGQCVPEHGLQTLLGELQDGDGSGGLRYVAFVDRVPARGLPAWEATHALIARGMDGARIADASDHFVIAQAHPDGADSRLAGLDLATDPLRSEAIQQAAECDCAAMSRPVALLEPPFGPSTGVLVALPIYAGDAVPLGAAERLAACTGAVVAMFTPEDLLQAAYRPLLHEAAVTPVCVVLKEGGQTIASMGTPIALGEQLSSTTVDVCGRLWTVETYPSVGDALTLDQFLARPSLLLPVAVFIVTVLCAWIVWTLNHRNVVVQQQVSQATADMRRKNDALESKERELEEANRRLLEMSNTDPLTGLLNRRAFEVQLDLERERARRTGQSWGLLILDVDHFKDFNDRYGHAAGDEVLRRVAGIIQNEARRIDTVARFGGEEFVVLAGGADASGLLALGERIRARIQEAALPHDAMPRGVLTVSIGGSLSSSSIGHESRPVFEVADRCLYQAKSTGRNRVVMVA